MRIVLILLLLISISGYGQYKDYKIGPKGDTLNRVDMKGMKQGPWVIHVDELRGERGYEEEGYFENNKKEGTWKRYSLDGDLIAIENYRWGNLDGKSQYFTVSGDLEHTESWHAVSPNNAYDTVPVFDVNDPSKIVRYEIVKSDGTSLKHGTWRFYDTNTGALVKTEKWFLDKPAGGDAKNDDDLRPIDVTGNNSNKTDTVGKKALPKPQAIIDYEKKNSGKKKIKVRDGTTQY